MTLRIDSLILASASPRRRELLAELGIPFEVMPCTLPEPSDKPAHTSCGSWAEALACFKAEAVVRARPDCWVLGADTVVECAGELLGKPADENDARRMLELQAGRVSEVITGICLLSPARLRNRILRRDVTRVWMRDDPALREEYLAGGQWRGKAGAYGIQDVGDRLIERLEGSFSNVVGLPLELVRRLLQEMEGCD